MTRIMLICAEDSGDLLAAELVDALREKKSNIQFTDSFVGEACLERGINNPIAPLSSIAKMGFVEILSLIPTVFRLRQKIMHVISQQKPDCVVLIDGFAFTHFVAKKIKKHYPHIKLVKYIAPKLWAWAPWRAKKLKGVYDLILACLPFEPAFFEKYDLKAEFVGHSVLQRFKMIGDKEKEEFYKKLNIPKDKRIIVLLPGSRSSEIKPLWPIFQQVAKKFDPEKYHFIVPIASGKQSYFIDLPDEFTVITNASDRFKAFQIADAALAASGTVSLELMVCKVPTVIAYKVSWLSSILAKLLIRVPYVTLLNIMLNKEVFPEYLQEKCKVKNLHKALDKTVHNVGYCNQIMHDCEKGINLLQKDNVAANQAAADAVLTI